MKSTTISLVEDEARTAEMLVSLLAREERFRIASHYPNAEEALSGLPRIKPDVVLVDLELPGMKGAECIRRLKRQMPDVHCLVITQFDDSAMLFAALQAGADGYLLKRAPAQEIIEAIRTVVDGGGAMSPSICRKVLDYFQNSSPTPHARSALTAREMEVLQLARRGKRAKEIARALGLTYETVRTNFRNIYRKLHVHSLSAAVEKAFET